MSRFDDLLQQAAARALAAAQSPPAAQSPAPRIRPPRFSAARPAPRRVVLLEEGGAAPRLLSEPAAAELLAELRRQARAHAGSAVAGEWLHPSLGWQRFLTIRLSTKGDPT